jgi:hypothetical protein
LLTPLIRDLFVTGPGPDAGGPRPGRNQRCHTPEKSGVDAALCVPLPAGAAVGADRCPHAGETAAASVTNKKKSRSRTFMVSALSRFRHFGW